MEYEEMLDRSRNSPFFKERVDLLKQEMKFSGDLRLILINENGSVWGFKSQNPTYYFADPNFIQSLKFNLGQLLKQFFNLDADPDVKLANGNLEEVEAVLTSSNLLDYVASHGGELTVVDIKEGKVFISMTGSCSGCAASLITMKVGVESVLKKFLPWVQSVQSVDGEEDPNFGIEEALDRAQRELREKEGGQR